VRRPKVIAIVVVVLGVALLVGGFIAHNFAAPRNALCQSGIGQIGQFVDNTIAHDCGLVTTLESAVGWIFAVSIVAIGGGAVLVVKAFQLR
jgi:hypothetical protein